MALEHILLGMLREKPSSGFDLKNAFDESARMFWHAELSQIYPTLKRLESQGHLSCELGESIRGPKRRVYHVTPTGAEALAAWLRAEPEIENSRFPYIAQIYFMHELDDLEETRRQVLQMQSLWAERLEGLELIERCIEEEAGAPEQHDPITFHNYTALRAGFHQLRGKLAWCEETLAAIESRTHAAHAAGS